MKHYFGTAVIALGAFVAASLGSAQTAQAGQIKIEEDYYSTHYGGVNGGGEFKVILFTGGGTIPAMGPGVQLGNLGSDPPPHSQDLTGIGLFQTFCIERSEAINNADVYDWTLDTAAVKGGFAGQDTTRGGLPADTLDSRTAWLYSKFWDGSLSVLGYNYTPGADRVASAAALQLAIWKIENELTPTGGSTDEDLNNAFNNNVLANTFFNASASHINDGIGSVRVLNLTLTEPTSGVVQRQSLLILIPLPSAAWLGLGMIGALGAVTVIRRRRRQALV